MDNAQTKIFHLRGVAASPGIGMGKAFVVKEQALSYTVRELAKSELKKEVQRFQRAIEKTRDEILETREKVLKVLGTSHAALIDVHVLILEDALFTTDVEKRIQTERLNAEAALGIALDQITASFDKLGDEYFRQRKDDVQDVGRRIMRHLLGKKTSAIAQLKERSVIIAHDLVPSDTVTLREDLVEGFATNIGGRTSHTAILAQGLEIPAVVGLHEVTQHVKTGDLVIIDGNEGLVIINPPLTTIENYRKVREIQQAQIRDLERFRDLSAQTQDGHKIALAANLESPEEIKTILSHGAEGVGLYRTEFLFLNRDTVPTEDEQTVYYQQIARQMLPYPVIIRTLDVGGDKLPHDGIHKMNPEPNPFLGLRGIRLSLKYADIFKQQLRAILRASVDGKLKLMYPMITSLDEVRHANRLLAECKSELTARQLPFDPSIEVGVMIEIPSAALISDVLAKEVDFLSIGTNDLIQYTLAVDRVNENVASLYNPMHLGILRLIAQVIQSGHQAGKWVGMCGEMAGDPMFTQILVGMGLDEFSVPAAAVPRIKQLIRGMTYESAQQFAKEVLASQDPEALFRKQSPKRFEA